MNVTIFVAHAVRKFLSHLLSYITHIDKAVSNVDQFRRGVRSKADDLNPATFIGDGVYCIDKVFIAGNEHRSVVASREGKHINGNLYVEIGFARAVVKSLQLFLHHAKAVAPHPQQEALLSLGSGIDTRVKESSEQTAVAQQHAQ